MSIAILTRNNTIIRKNGVDQTNKQSNYNLNDATFDIDGGLFSFKVDGHEFIHVDETNFHHIDKSSARSGYCLKSIYEEYKTKNYLFGDTLIAELLQEKNWFDKHFESAVKGDIFNITKVETSAILTNNYTKYYLLTEYKFKIQSLDIDFFDENQYPKANLNTNNPALEDYSFKNTIEHNRLNEFDGLFFSKNFGAKISNLIMNESAKQTLYKGIIKICFEIYWIGMEDILDILAIKSIDSLKLKINNIFIANGNNSSILRSKISSDTTLSKIDKVVAHLILDWGIINGFETQIRELLPDNDKDTVYAGLYQPFENYLTAVTNLYQTLLYYKENELFSPPNTDSSTWDNPTLIQQSNKRLKYIIDVFPPSALSLIYSYDDIKLIVEGYLKSILISNSAQDQIIKLLESLSGNPADGEKFLFFLLEKKDGAHTNFEILLFLFDKEFNRTIEERTQVGNLIFPFGRRQEFCKAVLNLWRKSNFNPNYNKNSLGYNPNFYFTDSKIESFNLKNEYGNANSLIELGSIGYSIDNLGNPDVYKIITDTRINYSIAPLTGEIMKLSMKYSDYISSFENGVYLPDESHNGPNMANSLPITSVYHLYQPVTLIAYKEGEPLLSQEPVIPAFLFYVSKNIEDIKRLEEMAIFATEISANILLFFALGGSTILEQIVYLRYITNIGRAIATGATVQATDVILVLKAIEGVSEAITIYGITASEYRSYLAQTASTDAERAYQAKIARIYFYITLIAAGGSIILRTKVNDLASEAISEIKYVDANGIEVKYFDELPLGIRNFIGELAGYETKLVNNFRQRIDGKIEITSKFDNLTPVQKKMFAKDFVNKSEQGLQELNHIDAVNNWKKLYLQNIVDRNMTSVITETAKTDRLINYYQPNKLRSWLKAKTPSQRWNFLDGTEGLENDIFNKISNKTIGADLLEQAVIGSKIENIKNIKNFIDLKKTKEIIRYVNDENKLNVIYLRNKLLDFAESGKVFSKNIKTVEISTDEIKLLRDHYINELTPYLASPDKLASLQEKNIMIVKFKVYDLNGNFILELDKTYISGTRTQFEEMFGQNINNLPVNLNVHVPPTQDFEFMRFTSQAKENILSKDGSWTNRFNDTEQYAINDYFSLYSYDRVVEMGATSVLWSCPSCQLYLGSTTEFIKSINHGNLNKLKITIKSNTKLKILKEARKDYLD